MYPRKNFVRFMKKLLTKKVWYMKVVCSVPTHKEGAYINMESLTLYFLSYNPFYL